MIRFTVDRSKWKRNNTTVSQVLSSAKSLVVVSCSGCRGWPEHLRDRREIVYGAIDDSDGGDVALGARAGLALDAASTTDLGVVEYITLHEVLAAFDRAIAAEKEKG